ncbi:uncharacterized protein LOC125210730 [Salvia hispanica]|uniref:uncharacterized protein LOC125192101 n=1 Tax=Salvia hispanica TaxID=49212 RepID=UPI002009561F|nr:uncharacterized protein LOC125192101 [Salvia hispanica]XP_047966268.1 uncharacterized protein LOC125210730 [Salvia hispanica]
MRPANKKPAIGYSEENLYDDDDDANDICEIAATSDAEVATPILDAAKNGIVEMVEGILARVPVAIHDKNVEGKNVVLIAVQYRQPHVYKFLVDWDKMRDTILLETDKKGNSALHLAAMAGEYKPWLVPAHAMGAQVVSVCEEVDARSPRSERVENPEGNILPDPRRPRQGGRQVAHQHLPVLLRGGEPHRHGGLLHLRHSPGRRWHPKLGKRDGLQHLLHLLPPRPLLLGDLLDHVPRHPDF